MEGGDKTLVSHPGCFPDYVFQNMTMSLPEIYLVEPTTLVSHPGRAFHMIMFSII